MCAGNRSMWFWLAIIALLCWSGSDLFSKIGCRDGRDKYNPLKMVIAVGVVMGIHAAYEIFVGGAVVTWHVMWTYLPVSLLYTGSMTLGYVSTPKAPLPGADSPYQGEMSRRDKRGRDAGSAQPRLRGCHRFA